MFSFFGFYESFSFAVSYCNITVEYVYFRGRKSFCDFFRDLMFYYLGLIVFEISFVFKIIFACLEYVLYVRLLNLAVMRFLE